MAKKEARMHNIALDYLSGFGMKAGINYTSYHSESHQQYSTEHCEGGYDSSGGDA